MFGDANLAYMVAKSGELPTDFTRGVWRGGNVGLLVAAVLTALFVVFFPLSAVGSMASLAFLIVYGTVSAGHLRVYRETGAKRWLLVLAVVLNLALFATAARLHHPHRAGEHVDHAAGGAGTELRIRGRIPEAHRPLPEAGAGRLGVAGPFLVVPALVDVDAVGEDDVRTDEPADGFVQSILA